MAVRLDIDMALEPCLERRHVFSGNGVALLVIACELSNSLRSPFFLLVSGSPVEMCLCADR